MNALYQQFFSCKLKNNQDPEEWITELNILKGKLEDADVDLAPTEKTFLLHILNNLGKKYENIVENAERDVREYTKKGKIYPLQDLIG